MKVLIVIPARGGSKGIPRKNIRPLNGKPLITYSIETAKKFNDFADVVVSTDDGEIAFFAEKCGVDVHDRTKSLANDAATLDPVIIDAYIASKNKFNKSYDFVVTMQPTSPLLKADSLREALQYIQERPEIDTVISAVNDTHLTWREENGEYSANYLERVNRQYLPKVFKETGGFVISRAQNLDNNLRIGEHISIFELTPEEAIDIDGYNDWSLCEFFLKRKKILFRVSGYKEIGLGHVYNSLILASEILDHKVSFIVDKKSELALKKIQEYNFPVKMQSSESIIEDILLEAPDLVVNDCLDTDEDYINDLRNNGCKVVNIEDLGSGSKAADLVINAIYPEKEKLPNHYFGAKYFCARDEFIFHKEKVIRENVDKILISFGGVDPNNLTKKVLDSIYEFASEKEIDISVVLGVGYTERNTLSFYEGKVEIIQNVKNISDYFQEADICFSSAGRTVYELALMGTPTVVLAQNERELTHFFACEEFGFVNLGLGNQLENKSILNALEKVLDFKTRKIMHKKMMGNDINDGKKRVIKLIRNLL